MIAPRSCSCGEAMQVRFCRSLRDRITEAIYLCHHCDEACAGVASNVRCHFCARIAVKRP